MSSAQDRHKREMSILVACPFWDEKDLEKQQQKPNAQGRARTKSSDDDKPRPRAEKKRVRASICRWQ